MDDLKTFARNDEEQQSILAVVEGFSDDIKMESGFEKSAKACSLVSFKRGKLTNTESSKLGLNTVIQDLEQNRTYNHCQKSWNTCSTF